MANFGKLLRRVDERAGRLVSAKLDAISTAIAAVRGVNLQREGDRIVISGRGLLRRWLDDASLRESLQGPR